MAEIRSGTYGPSFPGLDELRALVAPMTVIEVTVQLDDRQTYALDLGCSAPTLDRDVMAAYDKATAMMGETFRKLMASDDWMISNDAGARVNFQMIGSGPQGPVFVIEGRADVKLIRRQH
jgi:hypothetical protein